MKSIYTKYIPATNTRGSRIKAYDSDKRNSVTLSYDNALSTDAIHRGAAVELCRRLDWHGVLVEGSANGQGGNVYVFLTDWNQFTV
jgi:hypothetical protein